MVAGLGEQARMAQRHFRNRIDPAAYDSMYRLGAARTTG